MRDKAILCMRGCAVYMCAVVYMCVGVDVSGESASSLLPKVSCMSMRVCGMLRGPTALYSGAHTQRKPSMHPHNTHAEAAPPPHPTPPPHTHARYEQIHTLVHCNMTGPHARTHTHTHTHTHTGTTRSHTCAHTLSSILHNHTCK